MPHFDHFSRPGEIDPYDQRINRDIGSQCPFIHLVTWSSGLKYVWKELRSTCKGMIIPYNCHFFYTDTIFVRIKFTPKNADFSR